METKEKGTIIFDYDGTIHNTLLIYEPAFRQVFTRLVREGHTSEQTISSERISHWLGMNVHEMWEDFLPDLSPEIKEQAGKQVGDNMLCFLRAGLGSWYPEITLTLEQLKKAGYRLVILSNCKTRYRDLNWEIYHMDRWFDHFYDCETFGFAPKTEIIRTIIAEHPGPCLVVGDRASDMAAARAAGLPFIGCLYGFAEPGELEGADALVQKGQDILSAVRSLLSAE